VHWWVLGHSKLKRSTISFFSCQHLVFVDEVSHTQSFYVELLNSQKKSSLVNSSLWQIYVGPMVLNWNLSLTKIVQFSITLCTASLNIMKPPQCTSTPYSDYPSHRGISNVTQSMTRRDLTTIPRDLIATNKTKQNETKQTTFLWEIDLQPGHTIVPTSGLGTNYVILKRC
jgi:hypothetical protein